MFRLSVAASFIFLFVCMIIPVSTAAETNPLTTCSGLLAQQAAYQEEKFKGEAFPRLLIGPETPVGSSLNLLLGDLAIEYRARLFQPLAEGLLEACHAHATKNQDLGLQMAFREVGDAFELNFSAPNWGLPDLPRIEYKSLSCGPEFIELRNKLNRQMDASKASFWNDANRVIVIEHLNRNATEKLRDIGFVEGAITHFGVNCLSEGKTVREALDLTTKPTWPPY